ncbi:MAG: glutamine amidotransferase [Pseudomonadota bacterium]
MKPFLILQLRPETEAADGEFAAIVEKGGIAAGRGHRIRLDQTDLPDDLRLDDYAAVIVGGGPGCISDAPDRKSPIEARIENAIMGLMPEIDARDHPYLGCCYGIGILAHHLGAPVTKQRYSEPVGVSACRIAGDDPLLAGCPPAFDAFVGHKEAVQSLPPDCAHLVSSEACPFQMIRYKSNVYATQFHPEADADEFETRIRIYKDRGYFPPEDAERLIAVCRGADVTAPVRILRNFVARYG